MCLKYLIASIFLTALIPACFAGPKDICPAPDLITPCVCSKFWDHVCVSCRNIDGNDVIMEVLNKTSDHGYEYFCINGSSLLYFPASAFQIKKIAGLVIRNTTMHSLFDKPPQTKDLMEIELRSLKLSRIIQWDLFTGMSNLKRLAIHDSPLRNLDRKFIKYAPKSLETYKIWNCSISKLPDNAFQAMTNLTDIFMDYGKIKELKRNMFPSPAKIKQFVFRNQRIHSLPEDIFSDMPDLLYVFLNGNFISGIPENMFKDVTFSRRKVFNFEDNPIKCNCSIRWIVSKHVSRFFYAHCEEPKNLHGIPMYKLTLENFQHCAETETALL